MINLACAWAKTPIYETYHDIEWGVPLHDERLLFEFLVLEGAQAGLSWSTILNKRENYRKAFDDFHVQKVAAYGPDKVKSLLADAGIVRNRRLKVAVLPIDNAKAFIKNPAGVWHFRRLHLGKLVGGKPIQKPLGIPQANSRVHGKNRSLQHEQGPSNKARLPVRRQHDLLCPHAGHRHGQRPP